MKLSFRPARTGEGFFFRAETLWNFATTIDEKDKEPFGGSLNESFGGKSLHARSHGEAFMTVLDFKFRRSGLFLLDEPEAALSPQRQLSFLILIHQTLRDYPDAQILSFDNEGIHPIAYEDTPAFQITRRFLNSPETMLERLLDESDD